MYFGWTLIVVSVDGYSTFEQVRTDDL